MTEILTIGNLAGLTDTKVETIRFYERTGLLPAPARTAGNYRSYERAHVERLSFIRRARALGFPLEQVREMLALADQTERSCESVDAIARQHLGEVDSKIADLKRLRRELDSIIGQCRHGTIGECNILQALAPLETAPTPRRARSPNPA